MKDNLYKEISNVFTKDVSPEELAKEIIDIIEDDYRAMNNTHLSQAQRNKVKKLAKEEEKKQGENFRKLVKMVGYKRATELVRGYPLSVVKPYAKDLTKDAEKKIDTKAILRNGRELSGRDEKSVVAKLNQELKNPSGRGYKIKEDKGGYFDKYTLQHLFMGRSTGSSSGSFYLAKTQNGYKISRSGSSGYSAQD